MMELKQYHTSLEATDNVKETAKWKIAKLEEAGLPVDTGLADYFALAIDNLTAQELQLKAVESEIKEAKARLKAQKEKILIEGAEFLGEMGIDKLEGNIISSLTVAKTKPATKKEKVVYLVPKKEYDAYLHDAGLAAIEWVDVPEVPEKLRVNKRKTGTVTVENTSNQA